MTDVGEPATTAATPRNDIVVPGSRVRVRDTDGEHEYTVVTRVTTDAAPGSVSIGSPVGRALLGHGRGEQVRVETPGGVRLLTVVDVTGSAASAGSAWTCEA
jgi:transcription elongation GreA/GreB family factor